MALNKLSEGDVVAKKLAVKYNPPTIALEYHLKNLNSDFLLEVDLQESIKKYDDPSDICKWVFETYGDIINVKTVNQKQVMNLIQRVLIMKRMGSSKKKMPNVDKNSLELFEPDPYRKEEEKEFFKSSSNFYKGEDSASNPNNAENILNTNIANAPLFFSSNSQTKANRALEERNQNYSEDYIRNEINQSNRIKNYLSTGGTGGNENRPEANLNISETEDENVLVESPEKDTQRSSANEETEFHAGNPKNGNLAEFLQSKKSMDSDNIYNYMDEISVESLGSDDKF